MEPQPEQQPEQHHPIDLSSLDASLKVLKPGLSGYIPPLVLDLVRSSIDQLCINPKKSFKLPLEDYSNVDEAKITVLAYDKPASVAVLLVVGEPGLEVTFLPHRHPKGEHTLQLHGVTIDGDRHYGQGSYWSAGADSIHHPKGVLNENGMYMAVTYWPENTVPVKNEES